jgi:hypothetical protein
MVDDITCIIVKLPAPGSVIGGNMLGPGMASGSGAPSAPLGSGRNRMGAGGRPSPHQYV